MRPPLAMPLLLLLLLSACALPPPPGGAPGDAVTDLGALKADGAERPLLLVGLDQRLMDLAARSPSEIDGEPVGTPLDDPDRRFREMFARIQRELNRLGPKAVAYDVSFATHDGPATALLADTVRAAPFPVVLVGTEDGEPRLYTDAVLTGHPKVVFHFAMANDGSGVPVHVGAGVPLDPSEAIGLSLSAPDPLSVATFAADLMGAGVDRESALAEAHRRAGCMEKVLTVPDAVPATEATELIGVRSMPLEVPEGDTEPEDLPLISAADLLSTAFPSGFLSGVTVIVVPYWEPYGDIHDFFNNGFAYAGGMAHGWLVRELMDETCDAAP